MNPSEIDKLARELAAEIVARLQDMPQSTEVSEFSLTKYTTLGHDTFGVAFKFGPNHSIRISYDRPIKKPETPGSVL